MPTPETSRKRGKLSTEEEQYILTMKDKMSTEDIAKRLNRTEDPILRFLSEKAMTSYSGLSDEKSLTLSLKSKLHAKPFWTEIVKQLVVNLDTNELQYFENSWIELMKQFREDVTATEELEIKQWLTLEILMNRSMRERKKHIETADKLANMLETEYDKPEEERNPALIASIDAQLQFARNSISSYTNDHTKIHAQIKDIRRDLRAARSDRIKKIEDGKISFVGLLRQLEEADIREREGLETEIMSKAADKAKDKFSQEHQFIDGKFDLPILTDKTIAKITQGDEDG